MSASVWRLALLTLAAASALFLPAPSTTLAAAGYTISPTSGPPGTVITFSGTGCLPRSGPDGIFVFAGLPAASYAEQPQVIFESGPDGSFSGSIVVPASQPPGTYGTGIGCYLAEVGWPAQPDYQPFTVTSAVGAVEIASALVTRSDGAVVGLATFTESQAGDVRITLDAAGLAPGPHGFAVHSVGTCQPTFAAAGPHFNPTARKHGLQASDGPHAGDLPNLVAGSDGRAHFDMTLARFTLQPGPLSLFDADGSALVVHAAPDDQITDPDGNAGPAVACGVVQRRRPAAQPANVCPPNPSPPNPADPSVVVNSPTPFSLVSSPAPVSGHARVFEAVVSITIFDRNAVPIADTFTMASEAGPALAPYSASVPFTVATTQPGCIRVFEASAKDGSPINVVQVPVTLVAPSITPPSTGDAGLLAAGP